LRQARRPTVTHSFLKQLPSLVCRSAGDFIRAVALALHMQKDDSKYVLSYGGGVNSTALMILLVERGYELDSVIFSDTGAEHPLTYNYLAVAQRYLNDHEIPWHVVKSRNGSLYETCKRRRVIPSQIWRWSTRDYKITPIYAYYRSLGGHIFQYIGIARDEVERIKSSHVDYVTNLYPLIDLNLDREACIRVIKEAGLPVPVKSGCYFCPFNTVERWFELYQGQRLLFWRAVRLEESSKHFPRQKLNRIPLRTMAGQFRQGRIPVEKHTLSDSPCGGHCMT